MLPRTNMARTIRCRYCGKHLPTTKGLRVHIACKTSCRQSRKRVLARQNQRSAEDVGSRAASEGDVEMEDVQEPLAEAAEPSDNSTVPPFPKPTAMDDRQAKRWVETYPRSAGATKGQGQSDFSKLREEQAKNGENLWGPFGSQDEWELAQWLHQNVGHNATDEFLKLSIVSL